MTLPVTPNRISLLNIALEYPSQNGAIQPYRLSNYYRNGSLVPNSNQTSIPTRPGSPYPEIKFSDFHGTAKFFVFNDIISSDTADYNLSSKMTAAGWDGLRPVIATVTVNSGVILYATSVGGYAFTIGGSVPYTFPANSSVKLINRGYIIGKGGAGGAGGSDGNEQPYTVASPGQNGGSALYIDNAISIENYGVIAGGGGGGGGGGGNTYWNAGGGGGGGAGIISNNDWRNVTSTRYWGPASSFLNTYGIWTGGAEDVGIKIITFPLPVYFPTTGNYSIQLSSDNIGQVLIDGVVAAGPQSGFTSATTYWRSVTAGNHTISLSIENVANNGRAGQNPAGIGIRILNTDGSEVWHSRKITSLYTDYGGAAAYGGAGGGGGTGTGGRTGQTGQAGRYVYGNGGGGGNPYVGNGGNGGTLGQAGSAGQNGTNNSGTGRPGGAGGSPGNAIAGPGARTILPRGTVVP